MIRGMLSMTVFTILMITRVEFDGSFRCNHADNYKYAISRK
jgi:hypothetical protein